MSFLTVDDFTVKIRNTNLQRLIDDDSTILDEAIFQAEDTLNHYLGSRFDMNKILANRNDYAYLVNLGVSIALYYLYERTPSSTMPPKIADNYKDAMQELRDLRDGKGGGSLPYKTVDGVRQTGIKMGSDKPRTLF